MGTTPDQLRGQIEATRADMSRDVDALADKVSPSAIANRRIDSVRGAAVSVKERVMGVASHTGDAASSLSAKASDYGSMVSDQVSDTPDLVRSRAQGNPLAAGLIAFGAGLLVSSMLPASEREQRAAVGAEGQGWSGGGRGQGGRQRAEGRPATRGAGGRGARQVDRE